MKANSKTSLAFGISLWVAGSAGSQANPALVADDLLRPEAVVAFLLFGAGYADPCKTAYKDRSCPLKFGDRKIDLNDGTYFQSYTLSKDYCDVEAEMLVLASGERLSAIQHLGSVDTIEMGFSRFLGKSVEFVFTFSGDRVEDSNGKIADKFAYYHEYHAFSGTDFTTHTAAELETMRRILKVHQLKYCDGMS